MSNPLDFESRSEWGTTLAEKIPEWADTVRGLPEAALSNPGMMAVLGVCAAGLVSTAIGGPRVLRKATSAAFSDPSDLYVGDRDGGTFAGRLPVRLGWLDRRTGMRVIGPTGSGKTTGTTPFAIDDLLAGRDVLILETYGDLGTEVRHRAAALGVDILSADASEIYGRYWNPLAGEDTEDVANRLSAAISSSLFYHGFYGPMGESIVRNFVKLAREYMEFCEKVDPSEAGWDLLSRLITDAGFLHEILGTTTSDGKNKSSHNRYIVGAKWLTPRTRAWFDGEFLALSEDKRRDYRQNVANLFERLDNSRAAKHLLIGSDGRERLDLFEEINQPRPARGDSQFTRGLGRLIILRAPVGERGMNDSAARTVGYLGLKTVIDATQERAAPAKHVKPLSVYIDEVPKLMGRAGEETQHELAGWLTLVRDKNVAPHLIFQGHALMPRILLDALDATCRVFLVFPGCSADEVEYIRKSAGIVEAEVEDSRTSYSRSGKTYSEGKRTQEKKRLSFDEVKYPKIGEATYLGVKDHADELPRKLYTRRAPEPDYYGKLRERAEAKEEAAAERAEERQRASAQKEQARQARRREREAGREQRRRAGL
ncbi:type IV secretory system conjugative DNA transfer family protein [Rubrobacter aplysinae]|uniref:hypothetical protein n=1 Tax=Rubrobacter aplysinae TaxID=909625 RepID=UPI00064B8EF0|nr:hypothetical protein [Rubrobacter aplysinae]